MRFRTRYVSGRVLWQASLAALGVSAFLFIITSRTLAGRDEFVDEGMTQARVESLLGPPTETTRFNYGREVKQLTWREEPVTVTIMFDGTGVTGVICQRVDYAHPPSFWWRLRHRIEAFLPPV